MKKALSVLFALIIGLTASAQIKRIAILETVDKVGNVPYGICLQLRSSLTYAISSTSGYEGYDRVDMSQILGEQSFQRTGMVDEMQIRKLGEMTGCSYILVTEAAVYDNNHIIITAKILNVETAGVENSAPPQISSTSPDEMQNACVKLASKLIGTTEPMEQNTQNVFFQNKDTDIITIRVGSISFEMVRVEAGSFIMGCVSEQVGSYKESENPCHEVIITNDYYIGKFEVTQEVWETVVGNNPSNFKGFDKPVENVSWNDCQEFCDKLSYMTGRHFRLPTEAEWEYAARGGKDSLSSKYSGSSILTTVAWHNENSYNQTHSVGMLRPNELGVYDMSGNLWEWCQDWYENYGRETQTDPQGPLIGKRKVIRGGCWDDGSTSCSIVYRGSNSPGRRNEYNGFRVVLAP